MVVGRMVTDETELTKMTSNTVLVGWNEGTTKPEEGSKLDKVVSEAVVDSFYKNVICFCLCL